MTARCIWSSSETGHVTLDSGGVLFENAPVLIEVLPPYESVQLFVTTSWLHKIGSGLQGHCAVPRTQGQSKPHHLPSVRHAMSASGHLFCTLVAIDSSKFKAVNHRDRNFTKAKLERRRGLEHGRFANARDREGIAALKVGLQF